MSLIGDGLPAGGPEADRQLLSEPAGRGLWPSGLGWPKTAVLESAGPRLYKDAIDTNARASQHPLFSEIASLADASDSDLLAIARSAYEESIPNFARFLNDLFREHPRGQSEVRVRIDSKRWLRGAFISDFVTEPPWRHDRYLDGLTGQRDVRACVRIGDTAVQIDALSWDDLVLATPREPPSLGPWFDKWFLRPRPLEFDGLRLSGCIHSVQTNSHKDSYVTSIDLGTAKPQAFVELIDTCRRAQIPKVVVGSSYRADWSTD